MESIWRELLVVIGGNIIFLVLNMYFVHWRKRDNLPYELGREMKQLRYDIIALRGQVKYLEGRMNGRHWRSE